MLSCVACFIKCYINVWVVINTKKKCRHHVLGISERQLNAEINKNKVMKIQGEQSCLLWKNMHILDTDSMIDQM